MNEKKGNFFLVELVVNCLIFTICAAVCLSLFVVGFNESDESRELSMATLTAQSIAETVKACDGNKNEIATYIMMSEQDNINYVYYNEDWIEVSTKEESKFYATFSLSENNGLISSNIEIIDTDDTSIYSLKVAKYVSEIGGAVYEN